VNLLSHQAVQQARTGLPGRQRAEQETKGNRDTLAQNPCERRMENNEHKNFNQDQ
jgi:hypothetical protein